LLARLGRFAEARREVEQAVALTRNARECATLRERAALYAQRAAKSAVGVSSRSS
jgi:predicted RNA polymerase sigma factor